MIKVGLVGAGPWAGMFTGPMFTPAPDFELSGVWARRPEAAAKIAERFETVATESFDALLEGCEAVAFAVPPNVQAELAPRAARAGKHLLLEKPLAFTVEDAEAIARAADEAGVVTQVMLTYRYTPMVRQFVTAVRASRIRHIRTAWIGRSGLIGSPFATPWRMAAGAVLLDIGPHMLDLAEAVAGPITEVRGQESGGIVVINTVHSGGALGQLALSHTIPGADGPVECMAVTDSGRFVLPDPTAELSEVVQRVISDEFRRTITGEMEQPIDAHHGVHVQRLITAVAASIEGPDVIDGHFK
ncbi:MAG: Gfo/Idh/MocA family protein [Propionibacteriaceae bacterium]|jgi:predicted dehydrogenase